MSTSTRIVTPLENRNSLKKFPSLGGVARERRGGLCYLFTKLKLGELFVDNFCFFLRFPHFLFF
jgi:hypothetical protein